MGFLWSALDESSDRLQQKVFVVAGYLATQAAWTEMERQWMLRLEQERDPAPMKYFSSHECMRLTGEFQRFRKYAKPKGREAANAVREDLHQILRSARNAAGFALGINLKDYRAVKKSSRARQALGVNVYEHAHVVMFICIAGDCEDQMKRKSTTETVAFLCDEHQRSINVKDVYDKLKDNNPTCAPWMGSLTYMDNEKSPALQAGDLLASRSKDFLIECIAKPEDPTRIRRWEPILGRNVSIRRMDKKSLQLVVDANLPKKGKLSIYSTQQLSMFRDMTIREKRNDQES